MRLPAAVAVPDVVACHACDQMQRAIPLDAGASATCCRCGAPLYRGGHLERAYALALASLVVFCIASAFPIAGIDVQGRHNEATLPGAVALLWQTEMPLLAVLVFVTTLLVPFLELFLLAAVLGSLRGPRPPPWVRSLLRVVTYTRPWGMVEVFMLGVLVSLVKLAHLAVVVPGIALWSYGVLMLLIAATWSHVDLSALWRRLDPPGVANADTGGPLVACHDCGLVSAVHGDAHGVRCPRCHAALHPRKPDSLSRTWALLIAACVLYVPANTLPIMETGSMFGAQRDTIMSGVVYLADSGSWHLAALVFFASIVVPSAKLAALGFLLVSVRHPGLLPPARRTRIYRVLEFFGRWSMLDIYVVTLLAALVRIESLATILPGPGAFYFGAVVVLTMLAAMSFDPRLMWDDMKETRDVRTA